MRLSKSSANIANCFAKRALAIDGVQSVYARNGEGRTLHLWTVVERDDQHLRDRIYAVEAALYDQFPSARLDFYVLTLERLPSKSLSEVIPPSFVQISPKPHASRRLVQTAGRA